MKHLKKNEALDFIRSSDMKSRWGKDIKFTEEQVSNQFLRIRDLFLELEDSSVVMQYTLGVFIGSRLEEVSNIKTSEDDKEALNLLFERMKEKASLGGEGDGAFVIIHSAIPGISVGKGHYTSPTFVKSTDQEKGSKVMLELLQINETIKDLEFVSTEIIMNIDYEHQLSFDIMVKINI